MSKKLAAKAGLIQAIDITAAPPPAIRLERPEQQPPRPKTAPGSMLQFMSTQSAAIKEAEDLKDKLREFDGATPVRPLDPHQVLPSKWANRHADAFTNPDFEELKQEIESAGGNVQPIRVRPKAVLNGSTDPAVQQYEIVYGHRRHRACLDLGLPVMAQIEAADDRQLFEAMERENRGRKNLSAWEQGLMYRRALDEGLYPSLRKLAEAVKVDVSLVSKSVSLARLPDAVIQAFPSPLDIQFRWAQPLCECVQKDPEGLLERARLLKLEDQGLTANQVFDALTRPVTASRVVEVAPPPLVAGRNASVAPPAASMVVSARGDVTIKVPAKALAAERREALKRLIEDFLAQS